MKSLQIVLALAAVLLVMPTEQAKAVVVVGVGPAPVAAYYAASTRPIMPRLP